MESKRRGWWRWIVLGLLPVIGYGIIRLVWLNDGLEENMRGMTSALTIAMTILLSFLWTLIFITPNWKWRLAVGVAPVVFFTVFFSLFKFTGSEGNGTPNLVWRWEKGIICRRHSRRGLGIYSSR